MQPYTNVPGLLPSRTAARGARVSVHGLDRNLHRSYTYDMLSVRLPEEIEARLQALAKATGRSKSYHARQAILEKLEEMEDAYLGAAVLERISSQPLPALS